MLPVSLKTTALIITGASVLLALLLFFEQKENRKGMLPAKTLLSLLFVVTALIQVHPNTTYFGFLLAGLILCLGGDVFLALPGERSFLAGLVSFLLGHVLYVVAFFSITGPNYWMVLGTLGISIISFGVFVWLTPYLGEMKMPVLAYVIVISVMVAGAFAVSGDSVQRTIFKQMVLLGAICFYFSDIFVARDRFLQTAFTNRLIGLPLYYAGQFLLAFSVGMAR